MGVVVFLSPSILLTELKDTGVYVERYTSLHLLHYPGGPPPLNTQPHPNLLAISCLGEVAAYASQDITSDKTHKRKQNMQHKSIFIENCSINT